MGGAMRKHQNQSYNQSSNNNNSSVKNNKKKYNFTDDDMNVAVGMWQSISDVSNSLREPNLESWANEIRLMRTQDKLEHQEIIRVFTWANRDDFWRSNILSPTKLRKQWNTLVVKANNSVKTQSYNNGYQNNAETYNPFIGSMEEIVLGEDCIL